jgi:hypothetical protein
MDRQLGQWDNKSPLPFALSSLNFDLLSSFIKNRRRCLVNQSTRQLVLLYYLYQRHHLYQFFNSLSTRQPVNLSTCLSVSRCQPFHQSLCVTQHSPTGQPLYTPTLHAVWLQFQKWHRAPLQHPEVAGFCQHYAFSWWRRTL